ncbi:MAG: Hsp70 family protein [bacterium]|nr:Hsp70 family protein [bacterium]
MNSPAIGLDFGTTNSSIALVDANGRSRLASFDADDGPTETFRSVLYFEEDEETGRTHIHAGPDAIGRYLASEEKRGRLVQSLKSFLASQLFSATRVMDRTYRLEDLIALLLAPLREQAEARFGLHIERIVAGRPVHFVGADTPEAEDLAMTRLTAAMHNAGFREVTFEFEPVGAAYHYEQRLTSDELILIADFGGGTSDFSLLRVGPSFVGPGRRAESILGHDGVGLAGDAFDGKLVRHLVAPRLGRGAEFRSLMGNVLPVPAWIYRHLERWHHVSLLKSRKTLQLLLDLRREALEPEKLEALIHVVRADLGFLLYRATEQLKRTLSEEPSGTFRFEHEHVGIAALLPRDRFEEWIVEELTSIESCVDGLLERTGIAPEAVDRVFLTGGSSFVPAVRALFLARFGADRVTSGAELTSVASGLALRAAEQ